MCAPTQWLLILMIINYNPPILSVINIYIRSLHSRFHFPLFPSIELEMFPSRVPCVYIQRMAHSHRPIKTLFIGWNLFHQSGLDYCPATQRTIKTQLPCCVSRLFYARHGRWVNWRDFWDAGKTRGNLRLGHRNTNCYFPFHIPLASVCLDLISGKRVKAHVVCSTKQAAGRGLFRSPDFAPVNEGWVFW